MKIFENDDHSGNRNVVKTKKELFLFWIFLWIASRYNNGDGVTRKGVCCPVLNIIIYLSTSVHVFIVTRKESRQIWLKMWKADCQSLANIHNTTLLTNGESAILTNGEAAILTNGESAILTNGEAIPVPFGDSTIVTNGVSKKVPNQESTIVQNGDSKKVQNGVLEHLNNGEENGERGGCKVGDRNGLEGIVAGADGLEGIVAGAVITAGDTCYRIIRLIGK